APPPPAPPLFPYTTLFRSTLADSDRRSSTVHGETADGARILGLGDLVCGVDAAQPNFWMHEQLLRVPHVISTDDVPDGVGQVARHRERTLRITHEARAEALASDDTHLAATVQARLAQDRLQLCRSDPPLPL